jgi:glycosyltransferase involved in cell wall biosynthesis
VRFLFVHQNFPAQYRHLALHLAAQGHEVAAIGEKPNALRQRTRVPGIRLLGYELPPPVPADALGAAIARGRAAADAAAVLRRDGFRPDVVLAHPGWGEATFLKDVFPAAQLVLYCEFFYRASGADVGFDAEFPVSAESLRQLRLRNAPFLMALDAADCGIAPTQWQKQQFPARHAPQIRVIHDGIDTSQVKPDANARLVLGGVELSANDEVVTYIARNLEPYRGFHSFMRAIPEIQRRRPKAKIVLVGGDAVSYSPRLPAGETYRRRMMKELGDAIDYSRVLMPGQLPFADHLRLLQISAAHVYLTYPFVLSWSMLEAMAAGALVIGSRTAPVEEVIEHGENGLLADFFSPRDIAAQVEHALADRGAMQRMRSRARQIVVERYDLGGICLPQQTDLIGSLPPLPIDGPKSSAEARKPSPMPVA